MNNKAEKVDSILEVTTNSADIALSIIVPIYNVEAWLEECLSSIYAISIHSYEVILVNDGSPDNSHKIIEKYAEKYRARTVVVNRKNGGLSAARNSGLDIAKGDYIAFIDSDDFIDPNAFSKLVEDTIQAKVDIGCGNGFKYSEQNQKIGKLTKSAEVYDLGKTYIGEQYLECGFQSSIFTNITAWDKIYRRAFLKQHSFRFIEGLLHEDVPFAFSVFLNKPLVQYFDCYFYFYRVRQGSIMDSWGEKNSQSWNTILNHIDKLYSKQAIHSSILYDYLAYQIWMLFKKSQTYNRKLVLKTLFKPVSIKKRLRLLFLLTKPSSH